MTDARQGGRTATCVYFETFLPVLHAWEEPEIMNARDSDVLLGAGKCDLEFTRKKLSQLVAYKVAYERANIWRRIKRLTLTDACTGVAYDITDRIAAGFT